MSSSIIVDAVPQAFRLAPSGCAVIVVDMQNDFGAEGGAFASAGIDISGIQAAIEPTRRVLAAARRAGIPVVYLKMGFSSDLSDVGGPESPNWIKHLPLRAGESLGAPDRRALVRNTWNTEVVPELAPAPKDVLVWKTRFSGFYNTELDGVLKSMSVKQLVFTGCTTSVCVESTVRDAMFRDYTCLVLEDCTAEPIGKDLARSNHDASLLTIQVLFGWVSRSEHFIAALERVSTTQ